MELNCTALLNKNDLFYWSIRKEDRSNPNVHEDTNMTTWYAYVTCKRCRVHAIEIHVCTQQKRGWASGWLMGCLRFNCNYNLFIIIITMVTDHVYFYCKDLSLKMKAHNNVDEEF